MEDGVRVLLLAGTVLWVLATLFLKRFLRRKKKRREDSAMLADLQSWEDHGGQTARIRIIRDYRGERN